MTRTDRAQISSLAAPPVATRVAEWQLCALDPQSCRTADGQLKPSGTHKDRREEREKHKKRRK